ncbi:MAG: hypothetical protein HYX44_12655 [Aquabacterium sp.]|nr:hypothetical protein [Aquabacterium sp.]
MNDFAHHFEVCIASTEAELAQACNVRKVAYGHHLGTDAVSGFSSVEALDRAPGTVVLLCRDKLTGEAVGTARINVGDEAQALLIERHVILPRSVASRRRAEVTRLAVLPGASGLVKLCLMKAVYHCCLAKGIDWLVIAARNDALGRAYRSLGFQDFLAPGQMMPLAYAGNLPHYIFTMDVQGAEPAWRQSGHRLLGFMMDLSQQDLPDFGLTPQPAVASRSQAWVA